MSDVIPLGGAGSPNPEGGGSTCAGCGAPLAPDQRYCLSCGRPCSPVRLAFLDVLQGEYQPATAHSLTGGGVAGASYYAPPPEPDGLLGSLRRYSGLFGLLGVLLVALLIGLFVGHWLTGGAPGKQVLEVKGLGALAAASAVPSGAGGGAAGSAGSGSTGSGSSASKSAAPSATSSHGSKSEEKAEEVKEAKEVAKPKPLPAAHKASTTLQKLSESHGKKHAEEENKLGTAPIETGH